MITLYLVRHIPTMRNQNGIFMGREDCDIICPFDYNRVVALRNDLSGVDTRKVYSSPLIRCKKTAKIVFPNAEVVIDDRLIEKDLGDWGGKSKKSVKEEYPEYFDETGHLNLSLCPPNGEEYDEFKKRIVDYVNDMLIYNDDKDIIVFTHGGVIAAILKIFTNSDLFRGDCISTKSIEHLASYVVTIDSIEK